MMRAGILFLFSAACVEAQPAPTQSREFRPGAWSRVEDLPSGRLRTRIEGLSAGPRLRALQWLQSFRFTDLDLHTLQVDSEGGVYYAEAFTLAPVPAGSPGTLQAAQFAVPVSPFPINLLFHSKPGCTNVLYLNFGGENVSNTSWNTSLDRTTIPALAFSTDSDFSTFSDAEQTAIKRIWERVAEDYAPFNIDVTTERPASFGSQTAMALITQNTDANGDPNPSSTAGGVAYVNVFGFSLYASYRPAWIYFNNLASTESYIAEACSHEIGHNLGLSHDGQTDGVEYYGGHGTGDTSWGPIMGTGYDRNVSQWSKGEYYLANNTEDDLAIIAGKTGYAADDHGNTPGTATPLTITSGTNIESTTPETDPANTNRANKGILEMNTDVDVFSFSTGDGAVSLRVDPWTMPSGTRGGNLDVLLELHDANGVLLATNNPAANTYAQIRTNLAAGHYYLYVRNSAAGDPTNSTPTGYTSYDSMGQYFISGYIADVVNSPGTVQLTVTVNDPAWGTVSPSNGTYSAGSIVQVTATPAAFYSFAGWTNGATGTNDPISLVLSNDLSLRAIFGEIVTTNYGVPCSWLVAHGYTNSFETAALATGANGMTVWQSYIAGLDPNNPTDQFRLSLNPGPNPSNYILSWNTVTSRLYTVRWSTNLSAGFNLLPGASNLPATVRNWTSTVIPAQRLLFYRMDVQKP